MNPGPPKFKSHDLLQFTIEPNCYIYTIELFVFICILNKFLIKKKVAQNEQHDILLHSILTMGPNDGIFWALFRFGCCQSSVKVVIKI